MKKLSLIWLLMYLSLPSSAQINPEKLLGTWTLIKYDYGNGKTGDQTKSAFKKIKIFTPRSVTTLGFNSSGAIDSVRYAAYHPNASCCVIVEPPKPGFGVVEEVPMGNIGTKQNGKSSYTVNIDDEGFLHATASVLAVDLPLSSGDQMTVVKTTEMWMPVKEFVWLRAGDYKQSFNGGNIATRYGFDDRVLCFLKIADKTSVELKSTKEFPLALGFLPEEELDAIEVFPDETAIQKYGMKGRFGVLIVTLRTGYLPKAIAQLKKQRSID